MVCVTCPHFNLKFKVYLCFSICPCRDDLGEGDEEAEENDENQNESAENVESEEEEGELSGVTESEPGYEVDKTQSFVQADDQHLVLEKQSNGGGVPKVRASKKQSSNFLFDCHPRSRFMSTKCVCM